MQIDRLEKFISDDNLKNQILEALPNVAPVYLVKYKGKTFGYYPAEIKSIEDCIEIHLMQHLDNWRALACLMFRPVTFGAKISHRKGWKKYENVEIKQIGDFSFDFTQYDCKDIDLTKENMEFWKEFPVELVQANLNFTLGVGLELGTRIGSTSEKVEEMRQKLLKAFRELLSGTLFALTFPTPTSSDSTENEESLISPPGRYSIISLTEEIEKRRKEDLLICRSHARAIGGANTEELVINLYKLYVELINGTAELKHIKALGLIGTSFNEFKLIALKNLFSFKKKKKT